MKKEAYAAEESETLVGGVASHLNHPLGGGMFGQTGETDAARFQMNEEQDVVGGETSPGEHFDGEEVGTPARTAMWEAMKSFQVVFWLRLGAGWIPYRRRMLPTV